jgi:hypothetical protein
MLFSSWPPKQVAVRTDQWLLAADGRLFALPADHEQRHDLASQQPETIARLKAARERWQAELPAANPDDERPFTVGYREFPNTFLPAGEAQPHGQVRRSTKAPNCSYLTHWISPDDSITWDVEVHTPGRYRVVLQYTCPAESVGSEIEFALLGTKLQTTLARANDPPLVGAEHDRAPRGQESYVKDFAPLELGTTSLPAGRGQLSLRAPRIKGQQAADVRGITLTLVE